MLGSMDDVGGVGAVVVGGGGDLAVVEFNLLIAALYLVVRSEISLRRVSISLTDLLLALLRFSMS